jgi:NodT family efflux transporter outer membrane factor (OMF) lipoprotein
MIVGLSGCTGLKDYAGNGFKVGPNYSPAKAEVSQQWIDAADVRVKTATAELKHWWSVYNDPILSDLVVSAYQQNLTLKEAGCRILQARAQLAIATGTIFPQSQTATGGYQRMATPPTVGSPSPSGPIFADHWDGGFNLSWELDFWGRFRRAVEAANASLDASVEDYDDALVSLIGDVATNYIQIRQYQEQIELAKANVQLQRDVLKIVQARLDAGRTSELDVDQAQTTLSQTEAQIPQLEISSRQSMNALCVLLGAPPADMQSRLGTRAIPAAPAEAVIGIPAELLTRRPDIRRAERNAAAQAEQIGIAQADFYPHLSICGTIDYQAQNFKDMFRSSAFTGAVGPQFTWNILNYGRISNNVKLQDAKLQELLLVYRQAVLQANSETENGLVTYLRAQERARMLGESVVAAQKAVNIVVDQYKVGTVDFNRVATIEQNLVQEQDLQVQAQAQIALGLIQVYRALGGGWQLRLDSEGGADSAESPHASASDSSSPAKS